MTGRWEVCSEKCSVRVHAAQHWLLQPCPAVLLTLLLFQVSRILKVAKPNFVVMKLLAGGHKKESKVSAMSPCAVRAEVTLLCQSSERWAQLLRSSPFFFDTF